MRRAGWVTILLVAAAVAVWIPVLAQAGPGSPPPKVNFSRDVLPILSDKCFLCHGPDASSRKARLRLDTSEGATAERGAGRRAVSPGDPEKSLLVQRVTHKDDPMPPKATGKSLTEKEVTTLKQWIAEGAVYGKHWSFEPVPNVVEVPKVKSDWPRDDIDRFVLDRLTKEGLRPTREAPRERWLRRVTFDLTGLPPSLAEIESFRNDKAKDAFEKVVDRLLASPRYGERMASDWLDAARYSDSYGYQSDLLSPTWPYRDWVVRAFNDNKPYDQFLTEQIAGDLLPNATRDQRLATAFNRLHRQSNEGGSIPDDFKNAYVADRVDTFGTAVLGVTLGCARCHDHKFDPITQKNYYQLYAYFNSIEEFGLLLSTEIVPTPSLLLPTIEQEGLLRDVKERLTQRLETARQTEAEAVARFDAWLALKPSDATVSGLVADIDFESLQGDQFANKRKGKVVCQPWGNVETVDGATGKAVRFNGDNGVAVRGTVAKDRWDPFTWSFSVKDPGAAGPVVLLHRTGGTDVGFCGFDLLVEDGRLTARVMRHWPGNALGVRTLDRLPKGEWATVAWSYDGTGRAEGLWLYINGELAQTEVLKDSLWKKVNAYGDLAPSAGDWAFGSRFRDAGFKGGEIDNVAYADRVASLLEVKQIQDGHSLKGALATPAAKRDALLDYFRTALDTPVREAWAAVRQSQLELAGVEEGVMEVSVMEDTPVPVSAYVLARGDYDAPKSEANRVDRGVPESIGTLPSGRNDRLALARWAVDRNNPLTARVAVNRLWQSLFGVGLVETTENFGTNGGQPSHPELLDHLARSFVDSKWNVKALLRRLVLSATYRQDSVQNAASAKADLRNRLFWRGPSQRLPAEMVRDLALSAADLLVEKVGGPPVNPYQPAGIWQENNTMSPPFVQSKGEGLYRRSLYSTWKRTTPVPNMMLFDANSREACTVRRPSTSTPLQALVLLNDVQYVEAARVTAQNLLLTKTGDDDRLTTVFLRLAGRKPVDKERFVLRQALEEQRRVFKDKPEDAKKLVALGETPPAQVDSVELAALTVVVQAVMNSDAVVWKR